VHKKIGDRNKHDSNSKQKTFLITIQTMSNAEIILYQTHSKETKIEVRLENETVWLTQAQMVTLFDSSKQNINLHINNIFKEGELEKSSTVKEYLTVQTEGNRTVKRKVSFYNLDVIISVGYRVKSQRGTQFRIWATKILKTYLLKGYAVHERLERIENKLAEHDKTFDLLIKTSILPQEGIFFEGEIFDAYQFVINLIKTAKNEIVLIDNYVDDSVLFMLSKRANSVNAIIYTSKITKQLKLDLEKFNSQYAEITIKTYDKSHDRFLIIDKQIVYHLGASLKDLGKKWFAFSKIKIDAKELLNKLD
jgi:hypothetical protein